MENTTASPPCHSQHKPTHISETDRRIDSETLLGDEGRVVIEHKGQQYLLRQTQAGKLLLTK